MTDRFRPKQPFGSWLLRHLDWSEADAQPFGRVTQLQSLSLSTPLQSGRLFMSQAAAAAHHLPSA